MHRELDDLAISLATGRSRREALRRLALGAISVPGLAILSGLGLPVTDAEAKKRKKRRKKRNKKKITICHNGQTIRVKKNKRKKHLRHGDTLGECPTVPPGPPPPPACTPKQNPCAGRECGTVDNGCGAQVSCGTCSGNQTCNNNTGQCGCTPNPNACAGRVCGFVDNGCGTDVACGPNNGACTGNDDCNDSGQCVCNPSCTDKYCGSDGCTGTCGNPDGSDCPPGLECNSAATCDAATGECSYAIANAEIGAPCGVDDEGICVKNQDGTGTCMVTNNGSETCVGADPCGEVNPPRQCATANGYDNGGDCGCYSTTEDGGLCLRRQNSYQYPESAVGCFGTTVRPACNVSSDCDPGWVCAPLDRLGTSMGVCCDGYEGFRGACVQVATDICSATR